MVSKRLRSPYGGIFVGKAQDYLQRVSSYTPEELMIANFNVLQAKLLELLEGGTRYNKQARLVIAALELLLAEEQISPEYFAYVKLLLADGSLDRLASVMVQASALPINAARVSEEGSARVQVKILQDFLVAVLQSSENIAIREAGVSTIQRLRLEAGMSEESMDQLIQLAGVTTIEAASDDDENFDEEE